MTNEKKITRQDLWFLKQEIRAAKGLCSSLRAQLKGLGEDTGTWESVQRRLVTTEARLEDLKKYERFREYWGP